MTESSHANRSIEADVNADDSEKQKHKTYAFLFALLLVEAVAIRLAGYPRVASFTNLCFGDPGADLCSFDLVRRGWIPFVDFGYIYGLIPLMLGDLWYRAVGLGPWGWELWTWVSTIWFILLVTWFAKRVKAGASGWVLMTIALPILLSSQAILFSKGLEPLFLVASLTALASGRRSWSLVAALSCVFVKSGVSACLTLLVVGLIICREWRSLRRLIAELAPGTVVGATLFAATAIRFGARAALLAVFPLDGARIYAQNHFGFFHGIGRYFWNPPGARWTYYVGTPAGFWLAATAVLLVGGCLAGLRLTRGRSPAVGRDETILVCAILHTLFFTLMYGNSWSWTHYAFLLVLGIVAIAPTDRFSAIVAIALGVASVPFDALFFKGAVHDWKTLHSTSETYHLFATDQERRDWSEILRRIEGEPTVLLAISDGAAILDHRFAPPSAFYLDHAQAHRREIEGKLDQLRVATRVVCWRSPEMTFIKPAETFPEFATTLADFEVVLDRPPYRVYRRFRPSKDRSGSR